MKPSASQALDSIIPITGKSANHPVASCFSTHDASKDHFIRLNGIEFAGTHLMLDLWDAHGLDGLEHNT
jgi:S-adenosylmethionine decarboxylase